MSVGGLLPVRRFARLVLCLLAGFTYGLLTSLIPSPAQVSVFWVSNLAAPWLALAFLAGSTQRSWAWGAAAGALADVACVVGFYIRFLHPFNAAMLGLPESTPPTRVVVTALASWLGFTAFWFAIAIVAGLVFGVLGWRWSRSRSIVAGIVLAMTFILECLGWAIVSGHGRVLPPHWIWVIEVCVGVLMLGWFVLQWRASRTQLSNNGIERTASALD